MFPNDMVRRGKTWKTSLLNLPCHGFCLNCVWLLSDCLTPILNGKKSLWKHAGLNLPCQIRCFPAVKPQTYAFKDVCTRLETFRHNNKTHLSLLYFFSPALNTLSKTIMFPTTNKRPAPKSYRFLRHVMLQKGTECITFFTVRFAQDTAHRGLSDRRSSSSFLFVHQASLFIP